MVRMEFPCVVLRKPEALDFMALVPPEVWSGLTCNPAQSGIRSSDLLHLRADPYSLDCRDHSCACLLNQEASFHRKLSEYQDGQESLLHCPWIVSRTVYNVYSRNISVSVKQTLMSMSQVFSMSRPRSPNFKVDAKIPHSG